MIPEGLGRWPANAILDEVAAAMLDEQSGESVSRANTASDGRVQARSSSYGIGQGRRDPFNSHSDSGGASRFFYVAKASRADREDGLEGMPTSRRAGQSGADDDGALDPLSERWRTAPARNHHPTVKPTDLMRWLCRLVTPPGGLVLDPFCGSGSTGVAANAEGFDFLGIEREAEYVEIARRRIANVAPLFAQGGAA